jgi:hypothetical protein
MMAAATASVKSTAVMAARITSTAVMGAAIGSTMMRMAGIVVVVVSVLMWFRGLRLRCCRIN